VKRQIRISLLGAATLLFTALIATGQPKGPSLTVIGEGVDLWCYLEGSDHGPSHKECSTACAKAGNPIGLVDSKENIYVTAGIQDHQPARDIRIEKMNQQVTVTGTLVKKAGLRCST
jgi:hypothetical protein